MTDRICPRCHTRFVKGDDTGTVELDYGPVELSWHVCSSCYRDLTDYVTIRPDRRNPFRRRRSTR